MTCTCPLCRPFAVTRSPLASLPGWDIAEWAVAEQHNAQLLQDNRAKDEWRDIISDIDSIDPHATDLALAVAEEMQRGRG